MQNTPRYIVDFSDFVVEAEDEDQAFDLALRLIATKPDLPDVCEVSVCHNSIS